MTWFSGGENSGFAREGLWQGSQEVHDPCGWESVGFSFPAGDVRAYLETEGFGGQFVIMTASQHQAFTAAYLRNGYNGGAYAFTYACGGQSGGPATEIECELKLPPDNYFLVYVNDTGSRAGGSANIQFYVPG